MREESDLGTPEQRTGFKQLLRAGYDLALADLCEDLPEPLKPVITINSFLGIVKFIFFKLFSLAPVIVITSFFFI